MTRSRGAPDVARRVLTTVDSRALLVVDRGRSAIDHLLGSVGRWVVAYGTSDVLLV